MEERNRQEWFQDEDFWRETYDFMFPEQRFEATPGQIDQVLELTGIDPEGAAALDLCCGPGRCALALARRGCRVTGVDLSRFLLDKARERTGGESVEIEWVHQDMREFLRRETYDLVLSMFTSFGYFDEKTEDQQVLENMHANLKPGGVLVIDVIGKEWLARHFTATSSSRLEDGRLLIERREIFDDWSRIANEWIILQSDTGPARTFRFHHTLYSAQELRDRLQQAGFAQVHIYGNLAGDPYGLNANRLIALARKTA